MVVEESVVQEEIHLSRPSHTTLTDACARTLKQAIEDGVFVQGSQLPSEKDLTSKLGVSRTTLREAMRILEQQGLIVRQRGRGTFVTEMPMVKDLSVNFGITAMIKQGGYTSQKTIRFVRRENVSGELHAAFPVLPEGAPVLVVERVRMANQRPVVWSLDVLAIELYGENALDGFHAGRQSLYEFLAEELGVRVVRGVAELHPVVATEELAAKLNVQRGSPLLRVTQTDYDASASAVLYSIEYHVPDAFVFQVNRVGPYL